jgi:hypothetical protein
MAFPNSKWIFTDWFRVDCSGPVLTYIYSPLESKSNCDEVQENIVFTPKHSLLGPVIDEFQVITDTISKRTQYIPIYDTVLGEFYKGKVYAMNENPGHMRDLKRSVVDISDSVTYGQQTFYNIIKVKFNETITYENNTTKNYVEYLTFSKNVGLIRYELPQKNLDLSLDYYVIVN